jgi:serine/threonine protein kinase
MAELKQGVGRYEILGELGRGGMSTVFLARQEELDRLVALKELGAFRNSDPSFARRFLREAQLAGSLSDPNIVTVYDYFENEGAPYIAMEYLEHGSLRPHIGRMSLPQIGGVLQSVLAGLSVAEKRQIVHRDLKPENLLVTGTGRVKISDFGIAKATNEARSGTMLTSTGVAVGTPNYMAPEQATAQAVGPWTDLYSVGVMAFEFFIGHPPFSDADNALSVLLRQVNEDIPLVWELDPNVDPALSDWVEKMVAKDPVRRPQSAPAAWDELEDTLIALLGPRWQRHAQLPLDADAGAVLLPTPPTLRPQPSRPAAEAAVAPAAYATTMPPRSVPPPVAEIAPPAPRRARRRIGRKMARLMIACVAVVAAAAALLGRTSHPSSPTLAAGTNRTTTPAAAVRTTTGKGASPLPAGLSKQQQNPASGGCSAQQSFARDAESATKSARQYDNAAARIERLSGARVSGSPTARLASAMRRTAAAYRTATGAATACDAAGYTAALQQANTNKQAVNAALADLRAAARTPSGSNSAGGSQPSAPAVARTPCSGDSVSDDPSDESC